jgi:hypothetical protein
MQSVDVADGAVEKSETQEIHCVTVLDLQRRVEEVDGGAAADVE